MTSLWNFWRMQPPLILSSQLHITLFLYPLAEVLGRYRLPELPTKCSPLNMYHTLIMHFMTIKISFKPTLGREVNIHKSIQPVYFPQSSEVQSVLGSCGGLMFIKTPTPILEEPDWSFQIW